MSDDTKRERPEANRAITFDSMGQGYWAHKPGFRQRGGQSENSNGMGAAPVLYSPSVSIHEFLNGTVITETHPDGTKTARRP